MKFACVEVENGSVEKISMYGCWQAYLAVTVKPMHCIQSSSLETNTNTKWVLYLVFYSNSWIATLYIWTNLEKGRNKIVKFWKK